MDRFLARRELLERIEKLSGQITTDEIKKEKIRKQKLKRKKRSQEKYGKA